ncbi:MAG: hypothetical protein NT170_04555 [Candidatus Moranbacteria bacterium]|nr:hypothetical protein [Candidatus Moranbacteria bacterium]
MSSLAVIGANGAAIKVASRISLPEGFVLPKGSLLSWEDQPCYKEGLNPPERRVIRYKRHTKAYLGNYKPTLSMRIESSSPKELFELVEILYLYIGEKSICSDLMILIEIQLSRESKMTLPA